MVGKAKFKARIRELVENLPDLAELVEPLLIVRRVLREQIVILTSCRPITPSSDPIDYFQPPPA